MNNIPTAEEFFDSAVGYTHTEMCERAIEFAKLHVEAALKEASEKGISKPKTDSLGRKIYRDIDKSSILNAYPLENIK